MTVTKLFCLGIDSSLPAPDTRRRIHESVITSKVGGSVTGVVEEDGHQNAADRDVEPDGQRHTRQPPVTGRSGRARRGGWSSAPAAPRAPPARCAGREARSRRGAATPHRGRGPSPPGRGGPPMRFKVRPFREVVERGLAPDAVVAGRIVEASFMVSLNALSMPMAAGERGMGVGGS